MAGNPNKMFGKQALEQLKISPINKFKSSNNGLLAQNYSEGNEIVRVIGWIINEWSPLASL